MSEELSYSEALGELQKIVAAIDEDQYDLDELSGQVERAAALIQICREKITATEARIQTVMKELEEEPVS